MSGVLPVEEDQAGILCRVSGCDFQEQDGVGILCGGSITGSVLLRIVAGWAGVGCHLSGMDPDSGGRDPGRVACILCR